MKKELYFYDYQVNYLLVKLILLLYTIFNMFKCHQYNSRTFSRHALIFHTINQNFNEKKYKEALLNTKNPT